MGLRQPRQRPEPRRQRLDIVLRVPEHDRIPVRRLSALIDALGDSNIPFLVDVRDWSRLPDAFRREIERTYVVLARGG